MANFLVGLIDVARSHQVLAYILVFGLAASEAMPLLGAVVPGTAIILGISALIPAKAVGLWPVMIAATLGAILGDGIGYWFGHRYRHVITDIWPLTRYPRLISQGKVFFERHGGKSVFIGRFVPGVKGFVPLIAGIEAMRPARFYAMNIISACIWGASHVLTGALVGASFEMFGVALGRATIVLIVLGLALWGLGRLLRAAILYLSRRAMRHLVALFLRIRDGTGGWHAPLATVPGPARPELPGLAMLGAIFVGGMLAVIGVTEDIASGDPLVRAGTSLFNLLQSLRTGWADHVMVAVTELGDATVTIAVMSVALIWLAARQAWVACAYVIAAGGTAALFTLLMKLMLPFARPHAIATGWDAASYPSGHTTINAAFYLFTTLLMLREVPARWRKPLISSVVLFVAAIALSRLYLGAHWLADVIGGFGFGAAWSALLGLSYFRRQRRVVGTRGLLLAMVLTVLVVGTIHIIRRHSADMARYQPRFETRTMRFASWKTGGWSSLPARRVDLLGAFRQPFTVQWAGDLDALRAQLLAEGWRAPVQWDFRTALAWFEPQVRLEALPVLPELASGQPTSLIMTLPVDAAGHDPARIVLRLWRSRVVLSVNKAVVKPLWIGVISIGRLHRLPLPFVVVREQPAAFSFLTAALPAMRPVYRIGRKNPGDSSAVVFLGGTV